MTMVSRKIFRKQFWAIAGAVMVCVSSAPAFAVTPGEILSDPVKEQRARNLSKELRCLVCQNQSIDDSDAPLARDLRLVVRERIKAGDSDEQVMAFVVARYGEFVLLRPPVKVETLILWLTPLFALAFAIWLAFKASIKPREEAARGAPAAPLTADEEKRLSDILADRNPKP